jgi:hypothetical protein
MEQLPNESLAYLTTQNIGVLAVEMVDGAPHAASMHVAHTENPLVFYMRTGKGTMKCEPLLKNGSTRASLVFGADKSNMKTLQIDGTLRLTQESEDSGFMEVFFGKFPNKDGNVKDANTVFLIFTPTWWRYTDWTTPEGVKKWTSQ